MNETRGVPHPSPTGHSQTAGSRPRLTTTAGAGNALVEPALVPAQWNRRGAPVTDGRVVDGDLLERARAEDAHHWELYRRPMSAETLRKRLRIGAATSRSLVAQLRSDTHIKINNEQDSANRAQQPASAL